MMQSASNGTFYECNRATDRGQLECSYARLEASSPLGGENKWIGESVATAQDKKDGWTTMAGIATVTEIQAVHTRLFLRFWGPSTVMDTYYDDVSLVPIAKSCENLVLNGDFEIGDSRFWRPSDRRYVYVDISNLGGGNSQYSMSIQRYTGHRFYQTLDTRCLVEGQEFVISAQFRYLNATNLGSGVTCESSIKNQGDKKACPTVSIRGTQCVDDDIEYTFWNEIDQEQFVWDSTGFNDFEKVFTVDANIAQCNVSQVKENSFFFLCHANL